MQPGTTVGSLPHVGQMTGSVIAERIQAFEASFDVSEIGRISACRVTRLEVGESLTKRGQVDESGPRSVSARVAFALRGTSDYESDVGLHN